MTDSVTHFERNRLFRDHPFFPENLSELPELYATEEVPIPEKVIHLHYFIGQGTHWFIAELDRKTGTAFGYAVLNGDMQNAEWGYTNLFEAEQAFFDRFSVDARVILRDTDWVPRPFKDIIFPE